MYIWKNLIWCEHAKVHAGKTWKKLACIPNPSTLASHGDLVIVGAKRGFQGSELDQDEDQVDGLCKGGKQGKFVANEFPTAEADDQPHRVQWIF